MDGLLERMSMKLLKALAEANGEQFDQINDIIKDFNQLRDEIKKEAP